MSVGMGSGARKIIEHVPASGVANGRANATEAQKRMIEAENFMVT